ncbi:hypothetical protein M413DRAFT_177743 [Hebeloma cylindrosporum]|uniref:Uncharacterized protein n=1 Tax=Hebeloma cylindrosporum TaxID=76867 RepID=A0A0C2XRN4_HEBCY|nr:hypothetical protein M413DRAFT_177743 [Hebeloma cylindrosporum h7]
MISRLMRSNMRADIPKSLYNSRRIFRTCSLSARLLRLEKLAPTMSIRGLSDLHRLQYDITKTDAMAQSDASYWLLVLFCRLVILRVADLI